MYQKLIQSYIKNIQPKDIKQFLAKYEIDLTEAELNLLYEQVQKNWKTFLYENPEPILADLKAKMIPSHYQKMEKLYFELKNKYQNYL